MASRLDLVTFTVGVLLGVLAAALKYRSRQSGSRDDFPHNDTGE